MKVMTIRVDDTLGEQLDAVARVNDRATAEEVREALAAHIKAKMADPEFRGRLRASLQRNQEILDSLEADG